MRGIRCGRYSIKLDKTGFPLIKLQKWNFFIGLFPVSKYQFERFMSEKGPVENIFTDKWYREILRKNPRISWKNVESAEPWRLFLTGISSDVIKYFLRYLGRDYKLPSESQWRSLLAISDKLIKEKNLLLRCFNNFNEAARPVNLWIKQGLFPLVREGLLELLEQDFCEESPYVLCIGKPWQGLWPNTFNARDVKEIDFKLRPEAVGFRVVRISTGGSNI